MMLMAQAMPMLEPVSVGGGTPDRELLSRNGLLWMNVNGFSGSITTDLLLADLSSPDGDDSVVFGTTSGVYVLTLDTGEVLNRIPAGSPVTSVFVGEDLDGDRVKDVGFTCIDQIRPNVVYASSVTGKRIWDFYPTEEVYTSNLGWHPQGTRSWDSTVTGQGDGLRVYVTSWKSLYCLDGSTGSMVWEHTGEDDFWNVFTVDDLGGDGQEDLIVNTQEGALRAVSASDGSLIWKRVLEDSYTYKANLAFATLKFTSPKSLWKPVPVDDVDGDGKTDLAVGSEMGNVYLVSGASGKKLWEKDVLTLSKKEKMERSTYFSESFGNIILRPGGDCDGDGLLDVCVITNPGGDDDKPKSASMLVLSSALSPGKRTLSEKKSTPQFPFDGVRDYLVVDDETNDGWKDILLYSEGELKIADPKEGNFTSSVFAHSYFESNHNSLKEGVHMLPLVAGNYTKLLVTAGDGGILLIDTSADEILWDFTGKDDVEVSTIGDIDGKGMDDVLVTTYIDYGGLGVRGIYTISSETGEVLWEKKSTLEDLDENSFHSIEVLGDADGDGINDLSGYLQESIGDEHDHEKYRGYSIYNLSRYSQVFVISGRDGKYIWKKNLTAPFVNPKLTPGTGLYGNDNCAFKRIAMAEPVGDMTGDGIPDVLAMGEGYWWESMVLPRLYLFSGANGSKVWIKEYSGDGGGGGGGDDFGWLRTYFYCDHRGNGTVEWRSSIDGELGTGESAEYVLSTGNHTITVTLSDEGTILDSHEISLDVVPEDMEYADTHIETLTTVANSPFHVSAWGSDEAQYSWYSNITGFLSDQRETDIELPAGLHTLMLRMETNGRVFWDSWEITVRPAPAPVFGIYADMDGSDLRNLPQGEFITDDRALHFRVLHLDDTERSLKDYDISINSSIDGLLGHESEVYASLSAGNHTIRALIVGNGTDGNVLRESVSYNVTVLRASAPVPNFHTGGQARLNEYHFESHFPASFEGTASIAAAVNAESHSITEYRWYVDDGYAGNESTLVHHFNDTGTHDVTLSVTNELGFSSALTRTVTTFEDRMPEVRIRGADRGASYDTMEPLSLWAETRNVSFSGFRWESGLDGILDVKNSSINTYLSRGSHIIILSGTSSSGIVVSDTVTVDIREGPHIIPSVVFVGDDQSEPELRAGVPFPVRLDLNALGRSLDVDSLSYEWEADGVPAGSGRETDITLSAGTYVLRCTAEGYGQIIIEERNITVRSENAPHAAITSPKNGSVTAMPVTFALQERGGIGIDNATWDLGDGNETYGNGASHVYSIPGRYEVSLVARNESSGTYDNHTLTIDVAPQGFPVPVFTLSPLSYATTCQSMQFAGGGSFHSGVDTIDNYTWTMGDGTVLYGSTVEHAYEDAGNVNVRLTVRDTGGNTTNLTRPLRVKFGGHPFISMMNIGGVSNPHPEMSLSALTGDTVNVSASVNYYTAAPSLYEVHYSSDIDGALGAGAWTLTSLGPGLHTISASLVRGGTPVAAAQRTLRVFDDRQPILSLNALDETREFNRGGLAFPAGHSINFDVSSSMASANPGLGATLDEIRYTFSKAGTPGEVTLESLPLVHSFDAPGTYSILVRARNSLDTWGERTYPLNIYERSVKVAVSMPAAGGTVGREFEPVQLSVDTNHHGMGFSSEEWVNVTWSSTLDGVLGNGRNVEARLSRGEHNITVLVDNEQGLSASDSIFVQVMEGAEPVAHIRDRAELTRKIYSEMEDVPLGSYIPRGLSQHSIWYSDRDGELGEGEWLGVRLTPGLHRITLECYTSPEKVARDEVFLKVEGEEPLIVISEPRNGTIARGLNRGGAASGEDETVEYGKVEFLAREAQSSSLVQLPNGSYHVITTSWDRIYCGLVNSDGYAAPKPVWVFPDTYLLTLDGSGGGEEKEGERPRLNDHFPHIDNFDINRMTAVGDANGDGVGEISLGYWGPASSGMIILDVVTGFPLNLEPGMDEKFNAMKDSDRYNFAGRLTENGRELFGDDYDGDGYADLVGFDRWSDQWEQGPAIKAISGKDNTLLWEYRGIFGKVQDNFDEAQPVTFVEDANGDGIGEVAVASLTKVLILDGKTGKPLAEHSYQKSPVKLEEDTNPPPVSFITEVEDFSGDGKKDLVLLYQAETEIRRLTELVMIETGGYTPHRSIPLPEANILSATDVNGDGSADLMLSTSDLVFRLDSSFGLNILTPGSGDTGGDEVVLTWDKKEVPCEVFVDRISWGYYEDGQAELTLTGGEHIIEVRLTDELGGKVSDTIVISVPESAVPTAINYTIIGILVILFFLSFLLPMISRAKREKEMEKHKEMVEAEEEEDADADEFFTTARKNISRVWTKEKADINITEIFFEGEYEEGEYIEPGEDAYEGGEGPPGSAGRDETPGGVESRGGAGPSRRLPGGSEQPRLPPPPQEDDMWEDDEGYGDEDDGDDGYGEEWDEPDDDSYGSRQWKDDGHNYGKGGDWLD